MRLTSILTLAFAVGAFILSMLCLFAGSNTTFLQNADIMTLNISQIGQIEVFNTTAEADDNFLDDLINDVQETANDLVGEAADFVTDRLNISDFYAVHVMNYCEGMYEDNGTDPNASKNTTRCSRRNAMFHFDPTKIVEENLPGDITLEDIRWPDEIKQATDAIRAASIAMFVFWVVGIAFAGLAAIGALVAIFTSGRLSACGVFALSIISFLCLGIAAAIATAIMVKATRAINKYGNDIGIEATMGNRFLGMSWAATALMLLAAIVATVQVFAGRKERSFKTTKI